MRKLGSTDTLSGYGKKFRTCGVRGFHWKKDDDGREDDDREENVGINDEIYIQ